METKDLIGLTVIPVLLLGGMVLLAAAPRLRAAAFFLLVASTVISEKLSLTFDCYYWYRGTTRGFEFTGLDILALSLLGSEWIQPRAGPRRWFWPGGLGPLIGFFLFGCISVALAQPKIFGLFELSKILRGGVIFLTAARYVRGEQELGILAAGLAAAVLLEGLLVLKQHFLSGVYRAPGTLDHSNSLSMYLCMATPVLVAAATTTLPAALRSVCLLSLPFAAGAILLTLSRAGIPIFAFVTLGAAAACVSGRITVKKLLAAALVVLAVSVVMYRGWDNLKRRFEQASLKEEYGDTSVEGRGYYLRLAGAIMEDGGWGVGLNNWSYWVSKKYGARLGFHYEDYDDIEMAPDKELLPSIMYAAPAHNLGALTVGELGWAGLFAFALVWLRWFQLGVVWLWRRPRTTRQRFGVGFFFALQGVLLQSLFEWVYRQTPILFTFHLLMGALASLAAHHRFARRPAAPAGRLEPLEQAPAGTAGLAQQAE